MKRLILCMAVAAVLMAGCKQKTMEFTTHALNGNHCYLELFDKALFDNVDTIGVEIRYSVEWPDEGVMTPQAMRELQYLYFGDSIATVEEAAARWLTSSFCYDDEDGVRKQERDSIDVPVDGPSSSIIKGSCSLDNTLAVFTVWRESFCFGAAHGIYSADYLTVDQETGNVVHLADLVTDTNLLCEAIAHAIQELEVNKETYECLFDEFKEVDRMPMPANFLVDSARNGISVFYGLYEITPYCCGIQEITLPIFWLSKHVPLTPYAKRLFGEGCSIE